MQNAVQAVQFNRVRTNVSVRRQRNNRVNPQQRTGERQRSNCRTQSRNAACETVTRKINQCVSTKNATNASVLQNGTNGKPNQRAVCRNATAVRYRVNRNRVTVAVEPTTNRYNGTTATTCATTNVQQQYVTRTSQPNRVRQQRHVRGNSKQ